MVGEGNEAVAPIVVGAGASAVEEVKARIVVLVQIVAWVMTEKVVNKVLIEALVVEALIEETVVVDSEAEVMDLEVAE